MTDIDSHISTLYKRAEQAERENALNAQRILLHETQCTEKHQAVLNSLERFNTDFRTFKYWVLGMLSALLIGCTVAILTHIIK